MAASPLSKSLARLAKTYSVELIEAAVVAEFLAQRSLTTHNLALLELTSRDPERIDPVRTELRSIAPQLDIDTVLRVFEMAIPSEDRDLNGAIYTPRHITDFICRRALVRGDEVVADPSCGAGAFLLASARRLHALSGAPMGDIIERQVIGRDILPYSIRHARVLLALLALEAGDDREVIADRLMSGDALAPEWRQEIVAAGGVDAVVGNPPYIRFQELPDVVREHLSTDEWQTTGSGNFNLYFAFFELGLGLLNEGGVLGYITPNAHFATRSAGPLRALLAGGGHLTEIIDCGNVSIFEVATYTALTFLAKRPQQTFTFRRPADHTAQFALDDVPAATLQTAELGEDRWLLGYPNEMATLAAIESVGLPLRSIADLTVGLATLRDGLFLLGTPRQVGDRVVLDRVVLERDGVSYPIEKAVTRPIIKVSEHQSQASLDQCSTLILFPYEEDETGATKVVPEARMASEYPGALAYLESVRSELALRDHGKKVYEAWYAYGRRQGLVVPGRVQLLTPIYAAAPRFLVDPKPGKRFVNGYAVAPKANQPAGRLWSTPVGIQALRALLESDAMAVYVHLTSAPLEGGYRCYAGNYIAAFGVPVASEADIEALATMDQAAATRWYCDRAGIDASELIAMADRLLGRHAVGGVQAA